MAKAFSDDINSTPQAGRDEHLADLERQLSRRESPSRPTDRLNPYYSPC